jgi:hypothetical protein
MVLVAGDRLQVRALVMFDCDLQAQALAERESGKEVVQDLLCGHSETRPRLLTFTQPEVSR